MYVRKTCKKCNKKKKAGLIFDTYKEQIEYYICECEIENFKKLEKEMNSKRYIFEFF